MLGVVPVLKGREEAVIRANSKAEGSPADLDGRHELGRFLWEIASQSLSVAGDHLDAWRRLIEEVARRIRTDGPAADLKITGSRGTPTVPRWTPVTAEQTQSRSPPVANGRSGQSARRDGSPR